MKSVVDSKQQQLPTYEIIARSVERTPVEGVPMYAALLSIVKETSLPDCKVKQYGNTVFITHYGKGDNADLVYGRALNMDVAQNFIPNGEEYFKDLHREGIRRFFTQFKQRSFATAFKQLERRPITTEQELGIYDTGKGVTEVRISLAGDLIDRRGDK